MKKLYYYVLHETGYEDTGHIVAVDEEDAKRQAEEIADEEYLAVYVHEIKVEGHKISVEKING